MRKHNYIGWYDKATEAQKQLARKIADLALKSLAKIEGIYNGMLLGHTLDAAVALKVAMCTTTHESSFAKPSLLLWMNSSHVIPSPMVVGGSHVGYLHQRPNG